MLSGYIVDGVLKYVTGFSYGDWVQEALAIALKNHKERQIFLAKSSLRSGGSGSGSFKAQIVKIKVEKNCLWISQFQLF
ncbi:hypothetical protein ACTQ54_06145 [Fundicoccus sp. Sow4_H7]|uniref:hypothetical protein n=1 Tax=Fundicoccus sp. Sow4_H7 TaxID=3438784 RepID=UPI003F92966D